MDIESNTTYIDAKEGIGRLGGNAGLYAKLLTSFTNNTRMAALSDAVGNHDFSAAKEAAHAIKGVASNLALKELYLEIADLEKNLKENIMPDDISGIEQCMNDTLKYIDELISQIQKR